MITGRPEKEHWKRKCTVSSLWQLQLPFSNNRSVLASIDYYATGFNSNFAISF